MPAEASLPSPLPSPLPCDWGPWLAAGDLARGLAAGGAAAARGLAEPLAPFGAVAPCVGAVAPFGAVRR